MKISLLQLNTLIHANSVICINISGSVHTLRPELDETEKYLKEFIEQDIGVNEQYLRLNALLIMIAFIFACNATVLLFFHFLGDESITYVVQSKSVETVTKGEY